eukprot:SM000046S16416  [mRNA]  locus=s46:535011:542266:- [translate_table: standard]
MVAATAADALAAAWAALRLSVEAPERMPPWDAVVLTAASPAQAGLYAAQLAEARRCGRLAATTAALAVPDPDGCRIGSGGATFNTIRGLVAHITEQSGSTIGSSSASVASTAVAAVEKLASMAVLLVHAGGDSKRVPWANPAGKPFVPLPLPTGFMGADPDAPVATLFDHILALSAPAVHTFDGQGGLFIMTGDVLACFDSSRVACPPDGVCIIAAPVPLSVAKHHGVVLPELGQEAGVEGALSRGRESGTGSATGLVADLLQKPTVQEMVARNAVSKAGAALLDTGIFAMRGGAWRDLIRLALAEPDPVASLLACGDEVSLYEELAAAWVPARRAWLASRPLGSTMTSQLAARRLSFYVAEDLTFMHFGTSGEILDHLGHALGGRVSRRHLSSTAGPSCCHVAESATLVSTIVEAGASIGDGSLVADSVLTAGCRVGNRCIVMCIDALDAASSHEPGTSGATTAWRWVVPDSSCVWRAPLVNGRGSVVLACGVDDNPKQLMVDDGGGRHGGTFGGRPWTDWLRCREVLAMELWEPTEVAAECLWTARLFPIVHSLRDGLRAAAWLLGVGPPDGVAATKWRASERLSLAAMHALVDFGALLGEVRLTRGLKAAQIAMASIETRSFGRNLASLCALIPAESAAAAQVCAAMVEVPIAGFDGLHSTASASSPGIVDGVPRSRLLQARLDVLGTLSGLVPDERTALDRAIWRAVADETAAAVGLGSAESVTGRSPLPTSIAGPQLDQEKLRSPPAPTVGAVAVVELPVRLDLVGGWSDTPPWSLERVGRVLNLAVTLDGAAPVGARVTVTPGPGLEFSDEAGNRLSLGGLADLAGAALSPAEPFCIARAALRVTGYEALGVAAGSTRWGLRLETWAAVPRGSGLGTSSILAAALVRALLQVAGGNHGDDNERVSNLVLLLEQQMGSGGGWQDQVGGLYPGAKCTTSLPTQPMRISVEPILLLPALQSELQARLVVVFTGQVRLARDVLQKVVRRYLQRNAALVSAVGALAALADEARAALSLGRLDAIGAVLASAWRLNQELVPQSGTAVMEELLARVGGLCCGAKLVGAGGGGFGILMARDAASAAAIAVAVAELGEPLLVQRWALWTG